MQLPHFKSLHCFVISAIVDAAHKTVHSYILPWNVYAVLQVPPAAFVALEIDTNPEIRVP